MKPFSMTEVEMLFEGESNLEFIKKSATEQTAKPEIIKEEKEEGMDEDMPEPESEPEGSEEDLEEIREAAMNFMSASNKDLKALKEADPDLFEELCDAAKTVCEMQGYKCEKED